LKFQFFLFRFFKTAPVKNTVKMQVYELIEPTHVLLDGETKKIINIQFKRVVFLRNPQRVENLWKKLLERVNADTAKLKWVDSSTGYIDCR